MLCVPLLTESSLVAQTLRWPQCCVQVLHPALPTATSVRRGPERSDNDNRMLSSSEHPRGHSSGLKHRESACFKGLNHELFRLHIPTIYQCHIRIPQHCSDFLQITQPAPAPAAPRPVSIPAGPPSCLVKL